MKEKTRMLVEGSLAAAFTVALSYLKLFKMPQGGSVTLENIPLIIFALRYGFKAGFGAGTVAGILQLLLGGYIAHPVQAILDYPLAFGALGLAGVIRKPLWIGITLATLGRLACHVASGVVFFASYAPAGQSPLLYSLIYNGSYMLPNLVLALLLTYTLWKRLPAPLQVTRKR